MFKRIYSILIGITILTGCSSSTPEIHTLCLRDHIGNYIIKWETTPQMEGIVKVYISDNPNNFDQKTPVCFANIKDGITTYVTKDNTTPKYFELSFNDKYKLITGSRSIQMDSVQNMRDLGGYESNEEKSTRWGKLFRSGKLNELSKSDMTRLDNLGIKTIIDLRTDEEIESSPLKYTKASVKHIPISIGNTHDMMTRIKNGTVKKGDGIVYMQDLYLHFISDNKKQFAEAFDIFSNKDNYPILFNCSLGKDRTGFLAALLLSALDIPEETILKDYTLSNDFVRFHMFQSDVCNLSSDAQETMTVLLMANESFLDLSFRKIKKDYGSIQKYLANELELTEDKRSNIKDIILF